MKLFAGIAIINEIEEVNEWGIISGVTTNPTLIARSEITLAEAIEKTVNLIDEPISAELVEWLVLDLIEEAKIYATMHKNIVIKISRIIEGFKAVKKLTQLGIKTNVTLVFSTSQAIRAATAGATYVSPFMWRLGDLIHTNDVGFNVAKDIKDIFKTYGFKTQIIATSIRHQNHVD